MLLNKGEQRVEKGTYWNPVDGHRVDMKVEGILPGRSLRGECSSWPRWQGCCT